MFASENMTMGQMNAVIKRLGGAHQAIRFLRGETVIRPAAEFNFPIWKTMKLGRFATAAEYKRALNGAGYGTDYKFMDTVFKLFKATEGEVDLILLKPEMIGLHDQRVSAIEFCVRARELGLYLCTAEIALELSLSNPGLPKGDEMLLLPLEQDGWSECVNTYFYSPDAEGEDSEQLGGDSEGPREGLWSSDHYVFVKPRK